MGIPLRRHLPSLLLAGVLFVAVLWTAAPQLSTHFIGYEHVDHYGTQWFYWFVEQATRSGESPNHTDLFFYPWGKDIFAHTGTNVLDAYMALPFRLLLGPVAGYNVFVLVMLLVSALAFRSLARLVTQPEDTLSVDMAAVLFAFSPYVLSEVSEGRPTQAILLFPILCMRSALLAGRRRGARDAVLAGVFLALSGLQYWYYAFFGGMVILARGLWLAARPLPDAGGRLRTLGRHALIAAVALAITLPFAGALLLETAQGAEDIPGLLAVDQWDLYHSDPITREDHTIGLQNWQPLRHSAGFYMINEDREEIFLEHIVTMPLLTLPLLLLALWRPGRLERGSFAAMAATCVVIATGPLLLFGQTLLPNPLFIGLIKAIGFLQRLWWPSRMTAFLTILLGLAIAALLTQLQRRPRWQLAAAAALTVAWALDLRAAQLLPMPAWDATVPAGYRCLADGPEGALIELPYAWTQGHLYYQSTHGRPILGGMLENNATFTPEAFTRFRQENAFVSQLLDLNKTGLDPIEADDAARQEVYDLGYRYVVLQRDAFHIVKNQDEESVQRALRTRQRVMNKRMRDALGSPVYSDARVLIYAPWGDPPPCAQDAVEPDTEAVGLREISGVNGDVPPKEEQLVYRLFPPPDATDGGEQP